MSSWRLSLAVAAAALLVAGCSPAGEPATSSVPRVTSPASPPTPTSIAPGRQSVVPKLNVEVVAAGLEHPWDIGFLPDGRALVTQRPGRIALLSSTNPGATVTEVTADLGDVFARGEGGLLGMVVHPDFATSRLFTTCYNHAENGRPVDVRLVTWRLADDGSGAERVRDLLVGLPTATGGRHSGCRPTIAPDGALLVGTGDTARASIPQDRTNLGGKVLRLDLETGKPLPDNPFASSENAHERLVHSYGHRNVQGVTIRPGTNQIVTAEHGPSFNDEVNIIQPGRNYGWDPSRGGVSTAYDESVPMTDLKRFPDAVPAIWESGQTTQAICGATFVTGEQWGAFDGALVITALKGSKLLVMQLDDAGAVTEVTVPEETDGPFGRLRAARTGPDGALYVTTSNGTDDKVLRITPTP